MQISRFQVLARTAEARLEGENIVGRFGTSPRVITNEARLCETFANYADTPAAIREFTRKYAPLLNPAKPETEFLFELSEWRTYHQIFRNNWRSIASADPEYDRGEKLFTFPPGSHLVFSKGGNALQFDRFGHLLTLALGGLEWERIRFCPAPGCKRPFFVAAHLKQNYCGNDECVAWGDRKAKLSWWNQNRKGKIR